MQYQFEDYVLDSGRRELRRGTELIAVEPQVFDLLAFLIHRRDSVVSKDDLMAAIWNGRVVFGIGPDLPHQFGPRRARR